MKPKHDWIEEAKRRAAIEAVKNVKDGFVIGLGSGSTVAYAIEDIGRKIRLEGLHVRGVPTSYQALLLAIKNKIPIATLEEHPSPDLTVDGADQIDEKLNLIKGMGGALTREKIVAYASKRLIIIADENKKVKNLGENNHPVPIEVLPFATTIVTRKIEEMGGNPILREGKGKAGPVITDNGNFIIDANFGILKEPGKLENKLKKIPGIVETGLFYKIADTAYIGKHSTVEKIEGKRAR